MRPSTALALVGVALAPVAAHGRALANAANVTASAAALPPAEYTPTLGEWVELPQYPIPVSEAQGTVMKCGAGVAQVISGGFNGMPEVTYSTYKRDLSSDTNEWVQVADMPENASYPLTHMAQAVYEDVLYLAGGYVGPNPGPSGTVVYEYNCTADTWTVLPPLPVKRAGAGLVYVPDANALIFAGGADRETTDGLPGIEIEELIDFGNTYVLELDNPGLGWQDAGVVMPDPRNHLAGVQTCGRYIWVGGQHEDDEEVGNRPTVNELVFQPDQLVGGISTQNFKWGAIADLPMPLGHVSASSMPFKCGIVTVGGVTQDKERSSAVLYWNPSSDIWTQIGDYPISLATPVCGLVEGETVSHIWCATGSGDGKQAAFAAEIS